MFFILVSWGDDHHLVYPISSAPDVEFVVQNYPVDLSCFEQFFPPFIFEKILCFDFLM